jgi:Tfp pilus assembly protein PilO
MKEASKGRRKLKRRETSLIAAVLIAAIALAAWHFAGRNLHQEISGLVEMSSSLSSEIAGLEETLSRKESIESTWMHLQEDETRLNELLPEISELPSALEALENIVERYDSQISSVQAGEIENHDGYISLPFTLCAEGSPYLITAIVKALEAFPHLLVIDYLHWTSTDSTEAAIDVNFRIYFYSEPNRGY